MRVVLVDDQELIRRGMRLLLETTDGVEVVGEAADGQEGLAVVRQLSPDGCSPTRGCPGSTASG